MLNTPYVKVAYFSYDDSIYNALLERMVKLGWTLIRCNARDGVLQEIARIEPSLVLYDISLDPQKGAGVISDIRSSSSSMIAKVPVIMLSETGDIVEISQALKYGVNDYLVKRNFDADLAMTKVKHIMEGSDVSGVSTAATDQQEAQEGNRKIKLLIVEDDKFLRDLAVQKLTNEGLQVFAAVDGEQGALFAEKEIPDIVLLDILLPGIDGYEVLKRIKANPALAHTRVAMLSNFGQREDIEKALNAGAEQFFVKANYTLDEIVDEVKVMLGRK